ncbi:MULTISPECIES: 2-dehydropantoate 2-reductase [unclassified Vibrio]|uniref:2-dehydropantoate 2-reductase n=3 Tax=Vibrio TaxID=662 RepID=UPI0014831751|nr:MULTISPECIES: 2-dehydropantoate 2-reductase [unclassified Vibrio]NNN44388.1 2-dehydropantoate 2-reductase [Vibrio sp. 1-1(7)]NNN72904.1 2-dehydropantoate 2-reductase [Vibrio sp. 12-2(3-a)]
MNIIILGPGAIGSLWAYQLQRSGHRVALWGTQPCQQWSIAQDDDPAISYAYNQPATLSDADAVLITVKAWQVAQALTPLLPHLAPETMLIFMHNGMGALDTLDKYISPHPVILATTTHGAQKKTPHHVMHTGQGITQLGAYNPLGEPCSFLAQVLDNALPTVTWNHTITHALWHKLAINCVINPLTAIHQCRNGELAQPHYRSIIEQLIDELIPVMQAEQIPCHKMELTHTIDQVITATAKNYSSMQQDVVYRRQTEIDFITGYVVQKAQQHGLMMPTHLKLYQHIRSIETSWIPS